MVKVDLKTRKVHIGKTGFKRGRPGMSEAKKDQIVLAYNNGDFITNIAKNYGVCRQTVYRILRERS